MLGWGFIFARGIYFTFGSCGKFLYSASMLQWGEWGGPAAVPSVCEEGRKGRKKGGEGEKKKKEKGK